jgi:molecular chaperone HtpG
MAKTMAKETKKFDAEIGKVLDLMINSLYTHKDIFLRELLSNASDACDKLRYLALTDNSLFDAGEDLKIKIHIDKKANTLTISDNGVGMNKRDLVDNLGTIAKSGTQKFAENLTGDNKKDVALIGQFGVGFYSSFMIADKVTVKSNQAGQKACHSWESNGRGEFTIEELPAESVRGTEITLHLKSESSLYLDKFQIKHIVKTYSDHITFLIELTTDEENVAEVVNSSTALWARPKSEIKPEEYDVFYKTVAHSADKPWAVFHNKSEGVIEYTNLLFIPSSKPFDLFHPDRKCSIKLYVKKIFITEDNVNLIPAHLRFMRGLVDSQDLPLNISRETLQNNLVIDKIRKSLLKRILGELKKKAEKEPAEYEKFWNNFGAVLKEGLCEHSDKENILDLCLFKTSKSGDKYVSLAQYVENMKAEQKNIYYLIGSDLNTLRESPQLESFNAKDVEVLLLTDSVDDFWLTTAPNFKEKSFQSVTKIDSEEEIEDSDNKDEKDKKDKKKEKTSPDLEELINFMKEALKDNISDVRVTNKLTTSPVCLAVPSGAMDIRMERMLIDQGQVKTATKKILELNPKHKIIKSLAAKYKENAKDALIKENIQTLYDQACIIEGEAIKNPNALAKRINHLLELAA